LNDAYKQFKIDNPPTDKEAYALACKPISINCEESRDLIHRRQSAVPHMRAYKKQFTNLGLFFLLLGKFRANVIYAGWFLWNLHQILVVGAWCMLAMILPQASNNCLCGNASIKDFIQANKVDVRKWLRTSPHSRVSNTSFHLFFAETLCASRSIELQKSGGVFNFPTLVDPIFKGKHGTRS